jgi:NAD(P)-dependent dehydrogenase (short-subunit alcohol dehydrogenase family)
MTAFAAALTPKLLKLRAMASSPSFPASPATAACREALVYGPTKAALDQLRRDALARTRAPRHFGVRVINPGFVATPLTAQERLRACRR